MARIIYIEDDDLVGAIVKDVLTTAGHLVGVIDHGTLGFETVAFKKPELVILDVSLPGMTGIEIVTQLRRISHTYLTPVLMLTGNRNVETMDAAIAAGANGYMVKPFTPEDLVKRVDEILRDNGFLNDRRLR